MANICGRTGGVLNNATEIEGIREWSLTWTANTIETTSFDHNGTAPTTVARIACLKDLTGSFSGNHTDDASQLAVGTTYLLKLYTNATDYYSGSAIINSISPTTTVDGEAALAYNFQSAGDWTVTG